MRFPIVVVLLGVPMFAGEPVAGGGLPAATAKPADGGKWQLAVETSRKDGSKSITATLAADAPIRSGFGEVTPKLVLRYRAGRTSAFVVFDTFLGSGSSIDASVTIGRQPPENQRWEISSDSRAAFVPGDALAFMQRLKQADSFSVRIEPRKNHPVTASFTTTGSDLVIKALISAGVKYGG